MTPHQQELLDHEEFIAAVERVRAKGKTSEPNKRWLDILNSSAVTTLITVALGGILGNLIVSNYQDKQKQNALAQEQYQVFLAKQRDLVDSAVELVGDGQFDSAGLLALTQARFNVRGQDGKFSPDLQKKRDDILSAHDAYLRKWGTESFKTAVLVNYYFLGRANVGDKWGKVVDGANDLENCAEQQYESSSLHGASQSPTNQLCANQQVELNHALTGFSQALSEARNYAWQNFSIATASK
jgi:hypothetical protein